jgi:hypothetical protein
VTLASTRLLVILSGLVVLVALAAGLAVVGGPDAGRRDRRDVARLDALRQIADALACHANSGFDPPSPAILADVSPACLASDTGRHLSDPQTGAPYRIQYPTPDQARVCADFEATIPGSRIAGWPPYDAATGCVSVSLSDADDK